MAATRGLGNALGFALCSVLAWRRFQGRPEQALAGQDPPERPCTDHPRTDPAGTAPALADPALTDLTDLRGRTS
ncbi:hypothetical protein [Streptomyces sp. NPDC005181]|uniref:hypothetical protein n=1 Tax=Streptomyces sp. NPDC005181 TaxID=3156869 RepID=UPI0033AA1F17